MKECFLYEKKNGKVRCLACAHKCLISEDKTGICGVRKNIDGKLMLLVYGKIVAMHVDPIEKKPFSDFLKGTRTFSIGSVGCNFSCDFCQNWDISQASKDEYGKKILGKEITVKEIVSEAINTGCKSMAFTYNEPIIAVEFYKEAAELSRKKGLKNIMVSNGYWSDESFEFIKDYIDAVNIDLKGDDRFYSKFCGAKSGKVVRNMIKKCVDYGIHVEVTTLIIPGRNDSLDVLEEIACFLGSVNRKIVWHVSRFFPMYKMNDSRVTPVFVLEKAKVIGEKYLNRVEIGNI